MFTLVSAYAKKAFDSVARSAKESYARKLSTRRESLVNESDVAAVVRQVSDTTVASEAPLVSPQVEPSATSVHQYLLLQFC